MVAGHALGSRRHRPRIARRPARPAGTAHTALDLSDGLTGDLRHILVASGVGADLWVNALPVAPALALLPEAERLTCLRSGGNDYELLFTASPAARDSVETAAMSSKIELARIGAISVAPGQRLLNASGKTVTTPQKSCDHFA